MCVCVCVCVCVKSKMTVLAGSVCDMYNSYIQGQSSFIFFLGLIPFFISQTSLFSFVFCFPSFVTLSLLFLSSFFRRIQSARSPFSRPQVGTFPFCFLSHFKSHKHREKSETFLSLQSPFHPRAEICRRLTATSCGYSCERGNCLAV